MAFTRRPSTSTSTSTSASRPRRAKPGLQTRVNGSGYRQFRDHKTGKWELVHRRVAEKKVGGKIGAGREVHHIDGNRSNNRPGNLLIVSKEQHRAIHRKR